MKSKSSVKKSKSAAETKSASFFKNVYALVAQIPFGKVTTYGSIADALGSRRSSRLVGYALNGAAGTGLPCHRVVNRFGALSGAIHFGEPNRMRQLLEAEQITFTEDGCVEMDKYFWDACSPLRKSKSKAVSKIKRAARRN
jgi:methylated-DNA-protein-cysteine methyltransferase-like protein